MSSGVLLDTSFFIRFLNLEDPLFQNTENYYKYFVNNGFNLFVSTISIAEYCVRGNVDELPLRNLIVLPLNFDHSIFAGKIARILFENREAGEIVVSERLIIINDAKLFAQAHVDQRINYFCSSDVRCEKLFKSIKNKVKLNFEFINLTIPFEEYFGVLGL